MYTFNTLNVHSSYCLPSSSPARGGLHKSQHNNSITRVSGRFHLTAVLYRVLTTLLLSFFFSVLLCVWLLDATFDLVAFTGAPSLSGEQRVFSSVPAPEDSPHLARLTGQPLPVAPLALSFTFTGQPLYLSPLSRCLSLSPVSLSTCRPSHAVFHFHRSASPCLPSHTVFHFYPSASTCLPSHTVFHFHRSTPTCLPSHAVFHFHPSASTCLPSHTVFHFHRSTPTCLPSHTVFHFHRSASTCLPLTLSFTFTGQPLPVSPLTLSFTFTGQPLPVAPLTLSLPFTLISHGSPANYHLVVVFCTFDFLPFLLMNSFLYILCLALIGVYSFFLHFINYNFLLVLLGFHTFV